MTEQEQVESDYVDALRGGKKLYEQQIIKEGRESARMLSGLMWATLIISMLVMLLIATLAYSEEIDLKKIAMIESSNNPLAHNKRDDSRGLYQITKIALEDFNNYHSHKYTMDDLWSPEINLEIADWFINHRIPSMLKHYGKPDTVDNRLIAWNAGIRYVVTGKPIPPITRQYLVKYRGGAR